ncbi:MAG: hypothetical protein ABFE16_03375, partial [Armatimonadia bacterium]
KEAGKEGWQVKALDREGYEGAVLTRTAPVGAELLAFGDQKGKTHLTVQVVKRLFTTEYFVSGALDLASGASAEEPGDQRDQASARVVFAQNAEGHGAAPEGLEKLRPEALMGMLGDQGPYARFTLQMPGTIVDTNGEPDDSGGVTWKLDLFGAGSEAGEGAIEITAHSRVFNHQSIGRLADRLGEEANLNDMPALIEHYLERDLLPNPPKTDPLSASLDIPAYAALLQSVATLEEALGQQVTDSVIHRMDLNSDKATSKQLVDLWELLQTVEPEELTEVAAEALAKHLKANMK